MLSPTLQFDVTPLQQQLLNAYQAQAASLKVTSEEFDGWLERIDELSGVEVEDLTALHGQLIASGMLKFEISGRNIGLKYQLSQQGKKALEADAVAEDKSPELPVSEQADDEVLCRETELPSEQTVELSNQPEAEEVDHSKDEVLADAA